MTVKFVTHRPEVEAELMKRAYGAMEATADQMLVISKDLCPVDTGNLRNHTYKDTAVKAPGVYTATIGTNVAYAPYVELGTRYMQAQPFMKPVFTDHKSVVLSTLKKNLMD